MGRNFSNKSVIFVGAGVFALTGALEMRRRGYEVQLLDPGPVPHPRAASTDISKVVRLEYGADIFYTQLMEKALEGWRRWNAEWNEDVLAETGVLMLSREKMKPGDFEYESLQTLVARGWNPDRWSSAQCRRKFPQWDEHLFRDGFYDCNGGFAKSGRVIELLASRLRSEGVEIRQGDRVRALVESGNRVRGVVLEGNEIREAEETVVAAGAWSDRLVPELAAFLSPVAQPIFYLKPPDPAAFLPGVFPVFTADIKRTGWYGFPADPGGLVKLANHGPGRKLDPDQARDLLSEDIQRMREFLRIYLPLLAGAPLVNGRVCIYCDSNDGDFWIDRVPGRPGLSVATGGSGHAFKFAPVLGGIVADMLEEIDNPWLPRFRWRQDKMLQRAESARFTG